MQAVVGAVAVGFLLVSCGGSDGGGRAAPSASASAPARSAPADATPESFEEQARAALAGVLGGAPVASGVERVADGVHAEPGLDEGRAYTLSLVCVGEGGGRDVVAFVPPQGGGKVAVPCDGAVVRQQVVARGAGRRLDVQGVAGVAGAIAWSVDRVR
ncbi:hypothetical protein GCM10010378_15580 [Streptomyces viridochromogenes]